jgi:tetratricopeptide (TPR) repeat protein
MLKRLFGKQRKESEAGQDLSPQDDMIRLYDTSGNQVLISKTEYRRNVLPDVFEKARSNSEELYNVLVIALQDGLFEECITPARWLFETDSDKERGATLLGIVLMKNHRLDEAQDLLEKYLVENGNSGVVLTNLAKVFADKGEADRSLQTLWKALTVDPNQDNALDWWAAIHREKDGEEGFYRAVEEVAQLAGSWRPQLWLAKRLLQEKKIDSAIAVYREVLQAAPDQGDVLMMISGDLGNSGYLLQMLDMIEPIYKPEQHGPMAGWNLIQACLHLGEKERGLALCDAVESLQRYDLKQQLEQLRTQLEALP